MSKKVYTLFSLIVLLALVLSACAAPPAPTEPPATEPPATEPPATEPPTAEPTEPPATAEATEVPQEVFPEGVTAVITITLPQDATWSDGTPLTSRDVVGTWDILWMRNSGTWNSLADVVAKDDQTVQFQITTPGPAVLDAIVRSNSPRPYSQYGEWMDAAAEFRASGADREGADVAAVNEELNAFLPEEGVVYGPYNVDPASVTEAQLSLVKVPTGFNADQIDFDTVTVYWGDTAQDMPLYLSGEMDYSSNAYSPANLEAIRAMGPHIVVLGGPATNGPGIYFNHDVYPLGVKEVRQAIAYAIDRVENCTVAFGESCRPVQYMVGFTDASVPTWLSEDQIAALNTYDYDLAKAEELLTGLGFTKGSDGVWVDDQGNRMEFSLSVPADFTEYLASSENVAQQLAEFGIVVNVQPYPSAERNDKHKAGDYQMSMDIGMRFTYFHPFVSYDYNVRPGIGFKNDPEGAEGERGMNMPYEQMTADGKEINIKEWVDKMAEGFDIEAQKPYVADMASMFNENLPVVQMFERYLTDPVDTQTRVVGWLPPDDPIYNNNQNNSPVARQFLSGTLQPSETNTAKEFKTSYPYIQPPAGNYNLYSPDTVLLQGAVLSTFLYPPLTFYDVNEGTYVPFFAEDWEIQLIE